MHSQIRVRCPSCNARIKAPLQLLGQVRGCPQCQRRLVIQTKAPEDAQPLLASSDALARSGQP
jgi:uncharacterized paraquat-inducible protein A